MIYDMNDTASELEILCLVSAAASLRSLATCRYKDIRLKANARSNIERRLVAKHLKILSSGQLLVLRVVEACSLERGPVERRRMMEAIQLEILEKIAVECCTCYTGGFDLTGCSA